MSGWKKGADQGLLRAGGRALRGALESKRVEYESEGVGEVATRGGKFS